MPPTRTLRRRLAVSGMTLALTMVALPAAAHPVIVSSEPRQGARVVEPPDTVVLEFSEAARPVDVTLVSPAGHDLAHGRPVVEADRTIRQAVRPPPEQGSYTVRYQVMAQDGHTVTQEVTFDYAGPVTATEDRGVDTPSSVHADEPADERALLLRLWPLLLLAVAAAAGAAAAVRAFRATRPSADDR